MKVSEIFFSIQGEGINIGKSCIFIRLAGCNFRCSWCDTKYAYEGKEMTFGEIIQEIEKYPCYHIVWTGGEPTLQIDGIYEVIRLLNTFNGNYSHEIETNGTKIFDTNYFDVVTISPKVVNYDYSHFIGVKNVYWKFVIDQILSRILKKFLEKYDINPDRIYVQPQGVYKNKIVGKMKKIIENYVKKYGFRLSPRLHILIYGNVRGK